MEAKDIGVDQLAIPLITYNGSFEVNPEALSFLSSLEGPIGVVAVAGMYRTGKSYLLNRVLLDVKAGFGVGPSVNPCTKGLWIWNRSLRGQTSEGESMSILVIDSEGIGALDEDGTHDSRVFSLVVLLSSMFIYNSVGSIDEEALQNLSLVASLTNNIQVKNLDQACFPSFLWVVRDFALQLADEQGTALSPKEYLERALLPQKGTEEKNKIRNTLKTYFEDRDCFTMVRPTTDEAKLQHLVNIDLQDLRPEFAQQVHVLRDKVLRNAKVKMLKGRPINGSMFAEMIEVYTQAINNGGIPSIENAWTYVCKNESFKALKNAEEMYEIQMIEKVRLPMSGDTLKSIHQDCKSNATHLLVSKTLGDNKDAIIDLHRSISERYDSIKSDNQTESFRIASIFLTEHYDGINRRLKSGEFASFIEYERELGRFQEFFRAHGPEGVDLELVLSHFSFKAASAASDHFMKKMSAELELAKQVGEDSQVRLREELLETKEEFNKEKEDWQRQFSAISIEKEDFRLREIHLKQQVEEARGEREQLENESRKLISDLKQNSHKQSEETLSKIWDYEEKMQECHREVNRVESEKLQEMALLNQKISFLESSLQDSTAQSQKLSSEISHLKKESSQMIKSLTAKYETQIKDLQQRITDESEKSSVLEQSVIDHEQSLEIENSQLMEANRQLREQLKELQEKERTKTRTEVYKADPLVQEELQRLRQKLEESECKIKEKENQILSYQSNDQKQEAILLQKIEFLTQELEETKALRENERKHQELFLSRMNSEFTKEDLELEIQKVKGEHESVVVRLEHEFESQKTALKAELQALAGEKEELLTHISQLKETHNENTQTLRHKLETACEENRKALDKLRDLQAENTVLTEETEARIKKQVKYLETQIEDLTHSHEEEIQNLTTSHEEVLLQLKTYYAEEKNRMELRLREEKERSDKRYALAVEEYEGKAREEQEMYEEEINNLQEALREANDSKSDELQSLRQKSALDTQKIETLEHYLQINKEQLMSIQEVHSKALDSQMLKSNTERNNLLEKVEKLSADLASKDRELTSLQYKFTQNSNKIESKERELQDLKEQYEGEKTNLLEKLENLKHQNFSLADQVSRKTSEYNRELALAQQQLEFSAKRASELEKIVNDTNQKYNESIRCKNEDGLDLTESLEKLKQEKEMAEKKLEDRKKLFQEHEAKSIRQISLLEKEKAALVDKISHLDLKKTELENSLRAEIADLQEQLDTKNMYEAPSGRFLVEENERLRDSLTVTEKLLADSKATNDRDAALWENKFQFLVQQRDQARQDMMDSQRKFDIALDRLHKKGNLDKDKAESATASLMNSIEAKYQSQIKEIQENYQESVSRYAEKQKALEKENKAVREELENERKNKSSPVSEQKLLENAENERRLLSELETVKHEKQKRIRELTEKNDREKTAMKQKLSDLEQKIKEVDYAKSQVYLEHEKERAKWAMEKDHLTSQKTEMQDMVDRLEKRKEALLRENEKLRSNRNRSIKRDIPLNPNRSDIDSSRLSKDSGDSGCNLQENSPFKSFNVRSITPLLKRPT